MCSIFSQNKNCRGFAREAYSSITSNTFKSLKMFLLTSILFEVILFPKLQYQYTDDTCRYYITSVSQMCC